MKTMKKFLAGCAIATLLVSAAGIANAVSMLPVNLAQIVENTEKAFVGTIQSVEVVETPNGWAEKVTATVKEAVLGEVKAGDTVSWLQYRMGEVARLAGMPKYAAGEEHLIFLAGKGLGTDFQAAYGLGQGSFRVHRNVDTGEAFVRNEFMNSQLFKGVDTEALATAIVDNDPVQRRLTASEKTRVTTRRAAQLTLQNYGASDLDGIKAAAQAMKAVKNPSVKFAAKDGKTTGGKKVFEAVVVSPSN
ncbi:hypothetical protein CVU37_08975 [candidate division BRC1 bacterium HGW-BRC1-1]|nr:MAG: hypothetical protein CVU37_08975 [candidate division BRC1 bacterium HGW-BRC1-1]